MTTTVSDRRTAQAPRRPGAPVASGEQKPVKPADIVLGVLAWAVGLLFFFPVFWMGLTGFK
jgi:sorbitol/mannitol transport system permease protein